MPRDADDAVHTRYLEIRMREVQNLHDLCLGCTHHRVHDVCIDSP